MSDLLSHYVLVISQKAKVIEMTDEYRVFDDAGTEIGTIREVEQSKAKKAVRLFSGVDQFLTHKLGVFDSDGQQLLMLERPAKLMKSKIKVSDAEGTGRGAILQDNVVGPKHFALVDRRGDRRTVPTTTVTRMSSRATGDCGTTSIWSCRPATRGRPGYDPRRRGVRCSGMG